MNIFSIKIKTLRSRFTSIIFLSIILYACTAAPPEPEGGISGTGNIINCQDPANKHHKQCQSSLP